VSFDKVVTNILPGDGPAVLTGIVAFSIIDLHGLLDENLLVGAF